MQKAERTKSEMPGKKIRTSTMASARVSPENPGAIRSTSQGVASTPTRASAPVTSVTNPATKFGIRSAAVNASAASDVAR